MAKIRAHIARTETDISDHVKRKTMAPLLGAEAADGGMPPVMPTKKQARHDDLNLFRDLGSWLFPLVCLGVTGFNRHELKLCQNASRLKPWSQNVSWYHIVSSGAARASSSGEVRAAS